MILIDRLDESNFPTFPQFVTMLRDYERELSAKPVIVRVPQPVVKPVVVVAPPVVYTRAVENTGGYYCIQCGHGFTLKPGAYDMLCGTCHSVNFKTSAAFARLSGRVAP